MKVGNRSEEIEIKLYKVNMDAPQDSCIAIGKIVLGESPLLGWKKYPKEVILTMTTEGKRFMKTPPCLYFEI